MNRLKPHRPNPRHEAILPDRDDLMPPEGERVALALQEFLDAARAVEELHGNRCRCPICTACQGGVLTADTVLQLVCCCYIPTPAMAHVEA